METSLLIDSSNTQLTAIMKDFSLNDLILKMIPDLEDSVEMSGEEWKKWMVQIVENMEKT